MSRCWLWVLGIVSACGGSLRVHAPPPGADYLRAIRLEGNHAISTGALEPALALHEVMVDGAAIDPDLLTADADRIRAAYGKRGFFEAKVTPRVERGGDHAQDVVFTIVEGRRAVTRVEITGLPPEVPLPRARAQVALAEGDPFDYEAYDAAKQPLTVLVAEAGYAHAQVAGQVDADPVAGIAIARYQIDPGVRCTFGKIRLPSWLPASLATAVRARLQFATGDRYAGSTLEASRAEIYALGRFSSVQLRPTSGTGAGTGDGAAGGEAPVAGSPVVDIAVELVEATRHELHAGGGFGVEPATYEARLRGGGSLVPAAVPLLTLAADARVAVTTPHNFATDQVEPKLRGLVSLQYLDLLWPRLRGEVEAGADYQTVEAYTWTGEHLRLGLGTPLGPRWLQLRVGWVLEQLTFSNRDLAVDPKAVDPAAVNPARSIGLEGTQLRGAYQASLVADLRDNLVEPHRGAYLDLRVTKGTSLAGGDLTYLQLTPELRGYVSLGNTVLAGRARLGMIFGDVPVTERYYSGGTSGHRGFSDRHLSPLARATIEDKLYTKAIGGAGLIETGIELRRPLGALWGLPVGMDVFLDGGDVTNRANQLDPGNLYWAVGAGGWGKLVGDLKVRMDLGYRLNDKGAEDPLHRTGWRDNLTFHLGVGESY